MFAGFPRYAANVTTTLPQRRIVMTYKPTPRAITLEKHHTEREMRDARDRVLAREVGIEIGRRREQERQHKATSKAWSWGFLCGFLACSILIVSFVYGQREAYGKDATPITTIIGTGAAKQRIQYYSTRTNLPPAWRTWLLICQREQPAKGYGWRAVAWNNTKNHSYPGGCGLTRDNYQDIKARSWPDTMDQLSPRDQLWAAFFLYWKHARIGEKERGYAGGQRYGSTVWDVHTQFGFWGFQADGETRT